MYRLHPTETKATMILSLPVLKTENKDTEQEEVFGIHITTFGC